MGGIMTILTPLRPNAFKAAIIRCLAQTRTTHKQKLDSLLTLKFQTFNDAQILVR